MGRKSERREQRIAAARDRDRAVIEAGRRDPLLLDWMKESRARDPRGFVGAAVQAMNDATRPSAPEYQQALVALGGLLALADADAQAAAAAPAAGVPEQARRRAVPPVGLRQRLISTGARQLCKLILGTTLTQAAREPGYNAGEVTAS